MLEEVRNVIINGDLSELITDQSEYELLFFSGYNISNSENDKIIFRVEFHM